MGFMRLVLAWLAILTLALSSPADAASSVTHDPVGDTTAGAPAYVDIAQAKVTDPAGADRFTFSSVLAAPIPTSPSENFVAYNWLIDSVPGGMPNGEDYAIVVRWCSQATLANCRFAGPAHWEAYVNNLHGTLTTIPFKLDGAAVKAEVDPALIGGPTSFRWYALSRTAFSGTRIPPTDFAPDTGYVPFSR